MTRATFLSILFCAFAMSVQATTATDLRSRISIDGRPADFANDEWVLDASTEFRERPGDSRWSRDNDISAIAVTWDDTYLYVCVPAVTVEGTLMLFLDTTCGGVGDLTFQEYFRRNIEFGRMSPNFLVRVTRSSSEPVAGYLDCTRMFNLIETTRYQSAYVQDGVSDGALELAIPWEILGGFDRGVHGVRTPPGEVSLRVLAVVTGGEGSGAGDAAPDPSVVLEDDSTRVAIADNHVIIPLDDDGDGILDIGVSPRERAAYAVSGDAQGTEASQVLRVTIPLGEKLFSPLRDEVVRFPVTLESRDYTEPVCLSLRIFSSTGRVVRTLAEETPADFSSGTVWFEWDFGDDHGGVVPGGIYVLAVSAGAGKGTPKNTAKVAFAVVR